MPILKVYAWDAPEQLGGKRVQIAEIILKTKLYTSLAGDSRLFFQHERIWPDRRVWPWQWRKLDLDPRFVKEDATFPGIENWPDTDEEAEEEYLRLIQ